MKWRSKKVYIGGPLALVILAMVLLQVSGSDADGTLVQADLAFRDQISEVVTASGRIQPQTKVDITSEVSAEIIALLVKEGDAVTRGQRLLLLDTVQLESDVAQARYSLEELSARTAAAKSLYEKEELEFRRQERLYEQKLTSETAFVNARLTAESARANYEAMRAQVNTARARLEKAQDNLGKTSITAPMSGVVTYLGAEVGEIAQAQTAFTQGKTLMTVADLSVFEVEVDVDETEVAKVALGQPAEIRVDAFIDTVFAGTVVEIGNSALVQGQGTENMSTSFRVKVRFDETDPAVRPGMSATTDITTATAEDALLIPYAALVTREFDPDSLAANKDSNAAGGVLAAEAHAGEEPPAAESDSAGNGEKARSRKAKKVKKSGVFLCREGEAVFVEVTTGIADERNIVAETGVAPGDTVISGSFQTLRRLAVGESVRIDQRSLEKMKESDG